MAKRGRPRKKKPVPAPVQEPTPQHRMLSLIRDAIASQQPLHIDRIVQSKDGDAVRPSRSKVKAEIAFVRADGWTLGAPAELERVAYGLWPKEWICFVDLGTWEVTNIGTYVEKQRR